MSTYPSYSNAKEEFEQAWHHPNHTPIEFEAVDVNALLQTHYSMSAPFRLTQSLLWDAEVKKAWDPKTYIPGVVLEGMSWGRKTLKDGAECFLRASQQRAWLKDTYGQVVEEVYMSPREQEILFLGRAESSGGNEPPLRAGGHQPLFHVEHAVGGTDQTPLNLWRIVHLTKERNDALVKQQLTQMGNADWLREFVALFVEKDLGIKLTHRQVGHVAEGGRDEGDAARLPTAQRHRRR